MKRLWNVLVLTLAMNFVAALGGVTWLRTSGHLDRARVRQIKEILFPRPSSPVAATQPAESDPTTRPTLVLETLLARHGNMTAGQQLDLVHKTFDERQAELEHKEQVLNDLQAQIDLAQAKQKADRQEFEAQKRRFADEQEQARKLAADQGFQDALALYSALPAKQAKPLLLALGDETLKNVLEAMDKDAASKIIREFKTPDEIDRIHRILEKIRQAEPTTQPSKE